MPNNQPKPPIQHPDTRFIQLILDEDVGPGDITASLIPENQQVTADIISRERGVLCGVDWVNAVYEMLSPDIMIEWSISDGDPLTPNQHICTVSGPAQILLTAERSALNLLQTLSGTASRAHDYAQKVIDLPVRVLDTRKTLPGLRNGQKYAVTCGGCYNHRIGLYDGILIKENHIQAAGSITAAINVAKKLNSGLNIEVETETLGEVEEAIDANADIIMLDNFDIDTLRKAVELNKNRSKLEASGNITLQNIRHVAKTGVDFISIGDITKNVTALDLSMRFNEHN